MGFERNLSTVPIIYFTANGGTEGQIQLTTTLGIFVKQNAQISADGLPTITVEVKSVLSDTQILVGPTNAPITNKTDVSAYTVALGANFTAAAQPKATLPTESRMYASYIQEPVNGWRVQPVDSFGNSFDSTAPLPTNIVPQSQIPFTLTALTLPTLINEYVGTLTYTQVTSDTVGNEEVLRFYNSGSPVGEIQITKSLDGWVLNLGVPEESFLLLETGDFFELEDGSGGIELE